MAINFTADAKADFGFVPEVPEPTDTWDYILNGGKWENILPINQRQSYQSLLDSVKPEHRLDVRDRITSSLYLADLTGSHPRMFYDSPESFSNELFQKRLGPSQMLSMFTRNEKGIQTLKSLWIANPRGDPALVKQIEELLAGEPPTEVGRDVRIRIFRGLWERTQEAWEQSGENVGVDFLYHKEAMGQLKEGVAAKAEAEFEKRLKENPIDAHNWAKNLWLSTVGVLRPMTEGTQQGGAFGTAGGTAAIVAGQVGPQVFAPEEAITAPVAFGAGFTVGAVKYWSEQGSGSIYRQGRKQGLSKKTAGYAAAIGGPLYAFVEYAQVNRLLPTKGMANTVLKASIKVATNAGVEVGEEGVQKVLTEGAVTIGKLVEDQIQISDITDESKRIALEALAEMKSSVGPLTVLGLPSAVVGVSGAALTQRQTAQARQAVKSVVYDPTVPTETKMRMLRMAAARDILTPDMVADLQSEAQLTQEAPVTPVEPSEAAPPPTVAEPGVEPVAAEGVEPTAPAEAPAAEEAKPEQVDRGGEIIDRAIREDLIEKFVRVEAHREGVKSQLVQELAEITGLNPNDITDLSPKAVGDLIDIGRLPESQQETIRNLVTDYGDATERLQKLQTERNRIDAPLREFEVQPAPAAEEGVVEPTLSTLIGWAKDEVRLARVAVTQGEKGALARLNDAIETLNEHLDIQEKAKTRAEKFRPAAKKPVPTAKPKEPTTLGPDVTGILGGVPREAPGLTKAEIEHLGKREQNALRAAQKRGLKVGFKQGVAETILDARRTMAAILTKKAINEKNKMDLASIALTYLPKDQQGRFIRRILDLKTPKAAKALTAKMREAAETLIERQAVRDAKGKLKKQIGRIPKFGRKIKLRPAAIKNIESALEDVDVVKLSKAKRAELEAVRDDLKDVGFEIQKQFEVPSEQELSGIQEVVGEKVVRQLQRLQKESIADMSADEIENITDAIRYALDQNTKETQEKNKAKAERQDQQRKESKEEMTQSRTATEINTGKGTEPISLPQRILGFFRQDSMHRWALVESATAEGVNTTAKVLDLDIHKGKVKSLDTQFKALDLLKKELDRIGWNVTDVERVDEVHKITLGGKKYELTTAEIMSLGMNVLSDRNAKQIVRTKSLWIAGREVNTPTVGDIVDAMEVLTDKERLVMEFIPTLNEKVLMPAINEVSDEFFGFDLATDPFYWGLKRRIIRGVRGRIIGGPAIEDLGAFQEFLGSKIQLRISPFWDQLLTQVQNASSLNGMAVPMENARSMLNDKSWQESMDAAGRKKEKENLIKIFERTQGIASDKDSVDIIGSTFLNRSAKAILGWRISTVANQTASIPMAFTAMPDKYIAPLPGLKVQKGSAQSNRINEFSSFLRMRELGGRTGIITGDAGVSHSVANLIFRQKTDLSMEGMRKADRFAIETIDTSVQRWVADTTKLKVGGKTYWQEVARRTEEVVRKTQPMWDVDERSILGSTPSAITRSFFIFRSAREAVLNQNLMAVDRVIKGESGAVKNLANTLGATTLSTAMVVGIRTAMWTATGAIFAAITGTEPPDEDKALKEKVGDAAIDMLKNTVEYAPLGRIIIGVAKAAARKRLFDELHPDSILFGGVASAGKALGDMNAAYDAYFVDGDKEKLQISLLSAVDNAADAIGRLKGIPVGGILQLTTKPLERALRQETQKPLTLPD